MNNTINIVYFTDKAAAGKVASALKKRGLKPKLRQVRRCKRPDDILDYFLFEKPALGTLEKGYLRDDKKEQLVLLSLQKSFLDEIYSKVEDSDQVYIECDASAEYFYLKKLFFKSGKPFFSFGHLNETDSIFVVKGALDIGFHEASFFECDALFKENPEPAELNYPEFNGILALDVPPDAIPFKYVGLFRSPLQLTRNIIRFYSSLTDGERHEKVMIYNPPVQDFYTLHKRAFDFGRFLGERGRNIDDFSEVPAGTTVLTWSSQRFFSHLSHGLRPIVLTKSLLSPLWVQKNRTLAEIINSGIDLTLYSKLVTFIKLSEV